MKKKLVVLSLAALLVSTLIVGIGFKTTGVEPQPMGFSTVQPAGVEPQPMG